MTPPVDAPEKPAKRAFGCGQVLLIMLVTAVVTLGLTMWWVKRNLYAKVLEPVQLSQLEQVTLTGKLERLGQATDPNPPRYMEGNQQSEGGVEPEAYSEEGAIRELSLTEREVNALIANNYPDLAETVAVDFSNDMISVTVVHPVDEDIALLGGKTIRVKMGIGLWYAEGKASVVLKGVSLGSIPIPNAWIGDIIGVDLVESFADDGGFWKKLSDGLDDLKVMDSELRLKLKE
jgi:hypothetical protein